MQGPGGGGGAPSGAPSGAPRVPERAEIQQHFQEKSRDFFQKFKELQNQDPPIGHDRWSAVSGDTLLDSEFDSFGTLWGLWGLGYQTQNKPRDIWSKEIDKYTQANPGVDSTVVQTQAKTTLEAMVNDAQETFFEKDKQEVMETLAKLMRGDPPTGYSSWEDVPVSVILDQNIEGFGAAADTVKSVWTDIVEGYIAANPDLNAAKIREAESLDLEAKITLQQELKSLRESVVTSSASPEEIKANIRTMVEDFVNAQPELSPAERLEKIEEMTEFLIDHYEAVYEAVEFRLSKEEYFLKALHRFQRQEFGNNDEREKAWAQIVHIYRWGGKYTDINGVEVEFEGRGAGAEDYAWSMYERYIYSYEDFDEYAERALDMNFLSRVNQEKKSQALSLAYFKEQEEIAATSTAPELQIEGLLYIDMMRHLDNKYGLVEFINSDPDMLRHAHFQKYVQIFQKLDQYNSVFADPDANPAAVQETFQNLVEDNYFVLSSMRALLELQCRKKEIPFDPSVVIHDLQTLDQEMTAVRRSIWTGEYWSDFDLSNAGDVGNGLASFYTNWNVAILGKALVDKVGARGREGTFSGNWVRGFPPIPNIGKGQFGNQLITAFVAGESLGLHPVGRTVSLIGDALEREVTAVYDLLAAAGGLFNFDFNDPVNSLEGSRLAGARALGQIIPLEGVQAIGDTFGNTDLLGSSSLIERTQDAFTNGTINNPEVAAKFLKDPELRVLLTKAGEALALQKQVERLEREVLVLREQFTAAASDPTKQAEIQAKITEKETEVTDKSAQAKAIFEELFEDPANKEKIMLYRAWTKCFGVGLRGAPEKEDGTMDIDRHGQDKIWSVFNLTMDESYQMYHEAYLSQPGRDLARETAMPITPGGKSYDSWLLEPDPDNPGQMRRTEFAQQYARHLAGYPVDDKLKNLISGDDGNPFVTSGITPMVLRKKLVAHINAHNSEAFSGLDHGLMKFIGLGPYAWAATLFLVMGMIALVQKNTKWALAFPGVGSLSLLLQRLLGVKEDIQPPEQSADAVGENLLRQSPDKDPRWKKDHETLMKFVFDQHDKPSERAVKRGVDVVRFVEELQNTKMMIIPESYLLKALQEAKGVADPIDGMRVEFMHGDNLPNLQRALIDKKGIKDVYEALKQDLVEASKKQDTGGKTNPLKSITVDGQSMSIEDAFERDKAFIENIHEPMAQLVGLSTEAGVEAINITVTYQGSGAGSDTFEMRLKNPNRNKPEDIRKWWNKDNNDQYKHSGSNQFTARKSGTTADFENDFQILHSGGFKVQYGGSIKEISSISVAKKVS